MTPYSILLDTICIACSKEYDGDQVSKIVLTSLTHYFYYIKGEDSMEQVQEQTTNGMIAQVAAIVEQQPNAGHPSGFIGPENAAIVAEKQVT